MENKFRLYEPTLFLRDGKEWIKGFTMERPIKKGYDIPDWEYQCQCEYEHELSMKQFLDSAIEYPVCEGSNVRSLAIEMILNKEGSISFEELRNKYTTGIRIDSLADRLEVVEDWVDEFYPNGKSKGSKIIVKQIRLRPEVKEESQDELIKEAEDLICDLLGASNRKDAIRLIELIKKIKQ